MIFSLIRGIKAFGLCVLQDHDLKDQLKPRKTDLALKVT